MGGHLCRKSLKHKYFATLKVNKSVSICFEAYKYRIVFYCFWNNKTSQKIFLLTKARALALDDSIYASPGISSDFFMLIIVKR